MNNDYWRYVQEDKYYALYLWILDIKSKEDPKQLLLYGVAIPHNVHDNMQKIDKWDNEKLSTIKIEGFHAPVDTYRIHCHIKGEDLKTFSDYFFDAGKTYNICEISKQLEITGIEKLDEIKDFMIRSKVLYRKRPPVFLESNGIINLTIDDLKPINSLCQIPLYSESYCLIDKELFFSICTKDEEKTIMADYIKNVLSEELPFTVPGPDAERIGNFEILSHPYFDSIECDPIQLEITDKEKLNVVEVTFDRKSFSKLFPMMIRCQLKNGNVIISDQSKIIMKDEIELKVIFSADECCSDIEIEIWRWSEEYNKTSELVYSYKTTILREIHMTSGLSTFNSTINYTWESKKREFNAKIEANKVFSSKQVIGGYDQDPWVQASRKIRESFKCLYPSKSKSVFYETGWVGKEGFIKWLQGIVSKHSRSDLMITKILLIDPYFDDEGVMEFLAGSVEQNLEYEIVLDLQKKPSSETKIQKTCGDIKHLLPLKLKINGLKRKENDRERILHDRLILLLNKELIIDAYLLSNSLNGASKNHPLVVIPIPKDIQNKVLSYHDNLINEETLGNALEKVNIWPIKEQKSVSIKKEEEVFGLTKFPYIDLLLGVIFENEQVPDDQISKDKRLLLSPDDIQRKAQLNRIGESLNQFAEDEDFESACRLWCGVTNWMVRLSGEENDKSDISSHLSIQKYASAVIMICKEVIEKCHLNDFPLGYKDQNITNLYSRTLSQQINTPIIDSLPVAFYMNNLSPFREHPYNHTISESYRVLLKLNPDVSVELIEKAIAIIRGKRSKELKVPEDAIIKTYNLLLEELKQWLIHNIRNDKLNEVITPYLSSGEAFIRSMAVSSIGWYLYVGRTSFNLIECKPLIEEIKKIKDRKEVVESYIWLLSKCNFMLREDNGNLSFYQALEKELIYQIVACWEKDCFNHNLTKSLVCLLIESNSKGALEQTNGLFKQLADKGKICFDEYLDIIQHLLLEKLELHSKVKYHFYDPIDRPFSEQAIQLFKTSEKHIRSIIERICIICNENFITINKFLVKSRYYSEWSRSLESLCWIGYILALIIDGFYESKFDLDLLESAKQALEEIQLKIKEKDDSFIDVNRLKTRYEEKIRSVEVKLNKDPLS